MFTNTPLKQEWRFLNCPKSFVVKLSDSDGESCETQVWLDYALACKYIEQEEHDKLYHKYGYIIAMITNMIIKPEQWKL